MAATPRAILHSPSSTILMGVSVCASVDDIASTHNSLLFMSAVPSARLIWKCSEHCDMEMVNWLFKFSSLEHRSWFMIHEWILLFLWKLYCTLSRKHNLWPQLRIDGGLCWIIALTPIANIIDRIRSSVIYCPSATESSSHITCVDCVLLALPPSHSTAALATEYHRLILLFSLSLYIFFFAEKLELSPLIPSIHTHTFTHILTTDSPLSQKKKKLKLKSRRQIL